MLILSSSRPLTLVRLTITLIKWAKTAHRWKGISSARDQFVIKNETPKPKWTMLRKFWIQMKRRYRARKEQFGLVQWGTLPFCLSSYVWEFVILLLQLTLVLIINKVMSSSEDNVNSNCIHPWLILFGNLIHFLFLLISFVYFTLWKLSDSLYLYIYTYINILKYSFSVSSSQ